MELTALFSNWAADDKWASMMINQIADDVEKRNAMTTPIHDENFESDIHGALYHEVDTSPGAMS